MNEGRILGAYRGLGGGRIYLDLMGTLGRRERRRAPFIMSSATAG